MGRWAMFGVVMAAALPVALRCRAAAAQVVINELLAKNGLSGVDEDGDNEDWVELLNTGAAGVNLSGFGLTDDPSLPRKWVFEDVAVPAGGHLRVWLSGKDRFVPPPEAVIGSAGAYAFDPDLIAPQAEWRYLVADPAQAGPPAGWNTIGFNDSGWNLGRSGIGYGDGDDSTEVPAGTTAVFLRRKFRVEEPAALESLILQVNYDDGFVAYLNGARVAAANFGAGDPGFQSLASTGHEAGMPERFDLFPFRSRLVAGDNVLALAGLNTGDTSTDLSLLPELGTIPLIIHASFKLDDDGEYLALTDPQGKPVDEARFGEQNQDHSFGRSPDGTGGWFYLLTPTPEAPNLTFASATPISSKVAFDPPSGKHPGALAVTIAVEPAAISVIRFTTDGSEPTPASPLYQGPIPVSRNTVFRAAGFIAGERSTRIISKSYFLGGALSLPVLSISMEPADFEEVHNNAQASGPISERGCYLEVFEPDGAPGRETGCGLRLHGGAGRNGDLNTKKAYKLYFRRAYGDPRLEYPLIPDTAVADFDKLVLRSGFNDCFRTNGGAAYIRDQLIRDLHQDMGAIVSHGSWYNLYVNMRYRGVYNVVERLDEEFLQSYTREEAWDVMKTGNDVLVGENTEWERLHNFVTQNDLTQDALFEQAAAMVDLENFSSYMILNTWAQNHDWPHNNWYAARRQAAEGKWIYLSWDAEFGIGLIPVGHSADSIEFALGKSGYLRDTLFNFLKNAAYREYFAAEVDRHLFHALRPSNVLARIDRLQARIAPDMPEEAALFGRTLAHWQANVNTTRAFAQNRGEVYRNFLLNSTRYGYPSPPRVFGCDQKQLVNAGGVVARLRGVRLSSDTRFRWNGIAAPRSLLVSPGPTEAIVDVTLPFDPAVSGFPVIAAEDPETGERSEARGLVEVLPPTPEPSAIEPPWGDPRGGERVRIRGLNFLEGVAVRFGSVPAPEATRVGGSSTEIEVVTPSGQGEVDVLVSNRVQGTDFPAPSALRFAYEVPPDRFVRGDANRDGGVDLADALRVLLHLFVGSGPLACADAGDADDSGTLEAADAIRVLGFLFRGAASPPPPHPACGADPTSDGLDCAQPEACP